MVITNIYCIIILALTNTIGHLAGSLIAVLFFNTLLLPPTIIDISKIVKDNKREDDAMFPDFMYVIFAIMIPTSYYILIGLGSHKFIIYEFIIILLYTIFYIMLILISIGIGLIYVFARLCGPIIVKTGVLDKKPEIIEKPLGD